jgi:hypothetical protein
MNTVTSRIITGIFVVVITSSILGARAPDVEAEKYNVPRKLDRSLR